MVEPQRPESQRVPERATFVQNALQEMKGSKVMIRSEWMLRLKQKFVACWGQTPLCNGEAYANGENDKVSPSTRLCCNCFNQYGSDCSHFPLSPLTHTTGVLQSDPLYPF